MIPEKMLELILLRDSGFPDELENGEKLNNDKMYDRYVELKEEFLKPYVIDSTSRED